MPETVSFASLTRTALRDFFQNRSVQWVALPVGFLIVSSSFFASQAERLLKSSDPAFFVRWISVGPDSSFLFFLSLSLVCTLAQSPFRGIAILLLQSAHLNQSAETPFRPKRQDFFRVARTTLIFESGFWLFLIALGSILSIPGFLAWRFNPDAFTIVSQFGLILLLTLSLYLYLIKELSLLYSLLGNTSLLSAIDLGFRLFRRHSFLTLLFFTYASMLAILSTLSISLLGSMLDFFDVQNDFLKNFIAVPLFGLYFIFDQTLRLTYFRKIASRPKSPTAKVVTAKTVEPITGIPSA